MIRFGIMMLLMNAAGIALAVLGYLCARDGNGWFAVAFMVMSFCTIAVPRGSLSASMANGGKSGKNDDGKDKEN